MNKLNIVFIWLIFSLVFIIPLNLSNSFATSAQQAASICGGGDTDVKSSLVLSVVTGCLPGILEKTNEHREYKCKQIVCTYEAVKNNLDPTFCAKEYEYNTCKFIVGEMFAMPPMTILEDLRQMVANLLENPIGLLWGVATKASRAYVNGACSSPVPLMCTFIDNVGLKPNLMFLIVTDGMALAQTLMSMYEQGFDYFNGAPTYCEQVPEIRKEMEKIVKYA